MVAFPLHSDSHHQLSELLQVSEREFIMYLSKRKYEVVKKEVTDQLGQQQFEDRLEYNTIRYTIQYNIQFNTIYNTIQYTIQFNSSLRIVWNTLHETSRSA